MSAENYWLLIVQGTYFSEEIDTPKQGRELSHSSALITFCLFLDANGLL